MSALRRRNVEFQRLEDAGSLTRERWEVRLEEGWRYPGWSVGRWGFALADIAHRLRIPITHNLHYRASLDVVAW